MKRERDLDRGLCTPPTKAEGVPTLECIGAPPALCVVALVAARARQQGNHLGGEERGGSGGGHHLRSVRLLRRECRWGQL